ncbi:hypothetical protein T492DRAFT_834728 [Pavlovales sp. CCMP2436]|nr:hypothetical protein T492DRAFT_834728 [Pavlovales sp. CCMP2436]
MRFCKISCNVPRVFVKVLLTSPALNALEIDEAVTGLVGESDPQLRSSDGSARIIFTHCTRNCAVIVIVTPGRIPTSSKVLTMLVIVIVIPGRIPTSSKGVFRLAARAYLRLAAKHHPDKAGGSREVFEKVQRAYELATSPGALHSGPDSVKLELLLRTQFL